MDDCHFGYKPKFRHKDTLLSPCLVFGSVEIVAATLRFRFFTVLQLHPKPALSRQTLRLSAGLPVDLLVYFYKFRLFAIVLAA